MKYILPKKSYYRNARNIILIKVMHHIVMTVMHVYIFKYFKCIYLFIIIIILFFLQLPLFSVVILIRFSLL